ncbi:MAG: hypothetical protein AAGK69_13935, partial [Pseudomonadota bacterium]
MQNQRANPAFFAVIALLVFMSVGPVLLMFANSFKLDVDIISGTSGLLFLPTIQNYETALCDVLWYEPEHLDFCSLKFGGAFINSIIIALVSTILTLVIGSMAAYALVRFRFMGRDTVSISTLMVRMVPPAVLLVPVFGLWNNEFCLDRDGLLGGAIRDAFGGRGDVCLAGTHSGIILKRPCPVDPRRLFERAGHLDDKALQDPDHEGQVHRHVDQDDAGMRTGEAHISPATK